MTAKPAAPTPRTEAGRKLAARAKRESWSNWEGIAQFEIPAIEAEAVTAERERLRDGLYGLSLMDCSEMSWGDIDAILDAEAPE
jgi:hypothetical protein